MQDTTKYVIAVLAYLPICGAAYAVVSAKKIQPAWLRLAISAAILVAGLHFMTEAELVSLFS